MDGDERLELMDSSADVFASSEKKKDKDEGRIKTAVRVRPFSDKEIAAGIKQCVTMEGRATTLKLEPVLREKTSRRQSVGADETTTAHTFKYDYSFYSFDREDPNFADQEDIFQCLGKDLVNNTLIGYNSTIFSYGQTGAGKTYSMIGEATEEELGLIPRCCAYMFSKIEELPPEVEVRMKVSMLEIYNEKFRDLLQPRDHPNQQKLKLKQTKGGFTVFGLLHVPVQSMDQMLAVLERGNQHRSIRATEANYYSSRAHTIFTVMIEQKQETVLAEENKVITEKKSSHLNLVDLAGSEKLKKTKATGDAFTEGTNINMSLLFLGHVISELAKNCRSGRKNTIDESHIPYRQSKLTSLLKESLGGNAKTVVLALIAPGPDNYEETMSTLKFAARTQAVHTTPSINRQALVTRMATMGQQWEESDDEFDSEEQAFGADGNTDLDTVLTMESGMVRGMGKIYDDKWGDMEEDMDAFGDFGDIDSALLQSSSRVVLPSIPEPVPELPHARSNGVGAGTASAKTTQDITVDVHPRTEEDISESNRSSAQSTTSAVSPDEVVLNINPELQMAQPSTKPPSQPQTQQQHSAAPGAQHEPASGSGAPADQKPDHRNNGVLGLRLHMSEGVAWVAEVAEGFPAQTCGKLRRGQRLVAVDGVLVESFEGVWQVFDRLSGPVGSTATLTVADIQPDGSEVHQTVTLTRIKRPLKPPPTTPDFNPPGRRTYTGAGADEGVVGIKLAPKNGMVYVTDVTVGFPAHRCGAIRPGQRLLKVDDQDVTPSISVVRRLAGPVNSPIRLTLSEEIDGQMKVFTVELQRQALPSSAVSGLLQQQSSASGNTLGGLGVRLRLDQGQVKITEIADGYPAHRSGKVKPGQLLLEVDGKGVVASRGLSHIFDCLSGPVGSGVTLTLQEPGNGEKVIVHLERQARISGLTPTSSQQPAGSQSPATKAQTRPASPFPVSAGQSQLQRQSQLPGNAQPQGVGNMQVRAP
jgi:kinesin family protein 13